MTGCREVEGAGVPAPAYLGLGPVGLLQCRREGHQGAMEGGLETGHTLPSAALSYL